MGNNEETRPHMKYLEIYEDLKKKIHNGTYSLSHGFETEEILCKKYDTSRPTLRKSLNLLKAEGYIHSRQGSGIFVNPPEFRNQSKIANLSQEFPNIKNKVLLFEKIQCSKELCDVFHIDSASYFYHYIRVRTVKGVPIVVEETFMPEYLFPELTKKDVSSSVRKVIEQKHKYTISHDIKEIRAIKCDELLADALNKEVNDLALSIHHTVYLAKNIVAQFTNEVIAENSYRIASVR